MNGFCDALPAYFSGDRRRGEGRTVYRFLEDFQSFFQFNERCFFGGSLIKYKIASNFEIIYIYIYVSIIFYEKEIVNFEIFKKQSYGNIV